MSSEDRFRQPSPQSAKALAVILDRARPAIDKIQALVGQPRLGQPRVRAMLFYLLFMSIHMKTFYVIDASELTNLIPKPTLRELCLLRPDGEVYTTRQINYLMCQ